MRTRSAFVAILAACNPATTRPDFQPFPETARVVVMARRERVMMLEPFGKGIMGTTLLYPYEIRGEEGVFEEIPDLKLPEQMIGLAEDIIDRMSGEFEPDKFEDRYENAMIELIRSKQAGL